MFYFQTIKRNISIIILLPFYARNFFLYIGCDYNAGNDRVKLRTKSVMKITLITCRNFITVQTLILERLSQNPCIYSKHWQQVSTLSSRRNSSLLSSLPSSFCSYMFWMYSVCTAILDDSVVVWHPVGDTEHTRSLVPQCEASIGNTLHCRYYCIVLWRAHIEKLLPERRHTQSRPRLRSRRVWCVIRIENVYRCRYTYERF